MSGVEGVECEDYDEREAGVEATPGLLMFRRCAIAAIGLLAAATVILGADQPSLQFDHVWIVVSPNAPERAALERAGLQISPEVNRHDGQGTASITVEFENAYLELIWPEAGVAVQPGLEKAAEKFRQRMMWRTSGWCPIGVGFRGTTEAPAAFPFPTWSTHPDWLPPGSDIVILTPRDDTHSPSLFVAPRAHHPLGVHRITAIRILSPETYQPIEALDYVQRLHLLEFTKKDGWMLELTLDDGKAEKSKDLRPDLPLVIRY